MKKLQVTFSINKIGSNIRHQDMQLTESSISFTDAIFPGAQMKEFFQMHKSEVYNVFSWQMILNIVQKAQSCKKTKKTKTKIATKKLAWYFHMEICNDAQKITW